MAATVQIRTWTGSAASPTKTQVNGITSLFHSADEHSVDSLDNSILIPDSGTNYSYWKTFALYVSAISGGVVDNIRVYRDGANNYGTGVGEKTARATSYVQATGTTGITGDQLTTTAHTGLVAAPADSFSFTSASPLQLNGSTDAAGDVGDLVVTQLEVANTANSGTTPTESLTFLYDDTSS